MVRRDVMGDAIVVFVGVGVAVRCGVGDVGFAPVGLGDVYKHDLQ